MKYVRSSFTEKELLETGKPIYNARWGQLIHLCLKREGGKKMRMEIVRGKRTGATSFAWFFRIKARNNKTLCHSEQYTGKQMCMKAAVSIMKCKNWKIEVV